MNEPTVEEIKKSFSSATEEQLDFVYQIDGYKLSDSIATRTADAYQISYNEMIIVNEWLKYIFLGLRPVTTAFDYVLAQTNSEEVNIYTYMMQIVDNTPKSLRDLIKNLPFNKDVETELPGFFDGRQESGQISNTAPLTSKILGDLAKTNGDQDTVITKDDILADIENPTETVKTPSFALPKSKPQTTKILSSIASATIPDSTKPAISTHPTAIHIEESIDSIIDPFMNTIGNTLNTPTTTHTTKESTVDILTQAFTTNKQATPGEEIVKKIDSKLQEVQGTTPTETYKVADVPRHDPYREIPGM